MSTDRKKPGVALWATVAVVLLLAAYPLSIGPVEGLHHRSLREQGIKPPSIWDAPGWFYAPLRWSYMNAPRPIRLAMDWYGDFWH